MLKEFKCYTVVCDKCGSDSTEGSDYGGWDDVEYAKDVAINADFVEIDGKDYCPDCYELDKETNEPKVKEAENEKYINLFKNNTNKR